MNGYVCPGNNYGTLKFECTGTDRRAVLIIPINITNSALNFDNKLNMGWEWNWFHDEPKDTRLVRYFGLILYNNRFNVEYPASIPKKMRYTL